MQAFSTSFVFIVENIYYIAPDIQQHIRICLSVECLWDNQASDNLL